MLHDLQAFMTDFDETLLAQYQTIRAEISKELKESS
jgi:hypothetical protein